VTVAPWVSIADFTTPTEASTAADYDDAAGSETTNRDRIHKSLSPHAANIIRHRTTSSIKCVLSITGSVLHDLANR